MAPADRRFFSWLFIGVGPLFVLGGFAAAFTDVGAVLVYFGVAMLCGGLLLRTRLPAVAAFGAGISVFGVLTAWLVAERTG